MDTLAKQLMLTALLFGSAWLSPAQQSISQPLVIPMHCTISPCKILISPNSTQILVATYSGTGTITDGLGGTWIQDECIPFENGDCIFHAQFNVQYPTGDILTFPSGTFNDVYILQYQGTWNFVIGQYGTYAAQNSVFSDCTNGNDCPYNWTPPVEADAGNLLIAFSFSQATGPGLVKPGMGYQVEASDGFLTVEDMIAPTEGVYIGSLVQKLPDGSPSGGSHWVMGIGVYARSY